MSHSEANIEKRKAHAEQAQYENRMKRNALRRKTPIETAPTAPLPPRTERRKGWLTGIIDALKKLIGR